MRCDACCWFTVGLIEEELVEEGREEMAEHRVLENFYYVFFFCFIFFNIVLTWKFVGASKVSVLYVCVYIYIYIDDMMFTNSTKAVMCVTWKKNLINIWYLDFYKFLVS